MRRTLALAGVAVLGVAGLAGPTSADPGAGIAVFEGVLINEVAAEGAIIPHSIDFTGGYIELINTNLGNVDIAGWEVIVCNTTDEFDLTIPNDAAAVLGPGETYLIADVDYSDPNVIPNVQFSNPGEVLEQAGGGVQVVNDGVGSEVQDELKWGDPHPTCAGFPDIGTTPTGSQSAKRSVSPPWNLDDPNPLRAT